MLHRSICIWPRADAIPFHWRRVAGKQTQMIRSMRAFGVTSVIALMAAAAAGPARAESAQDILSNFNLVTTGNVSTNSDILGSAVVGGNFGGGNPTLFGGSGYSSAPDLYLYGKLNTGLNLNDGGSIYYAGSVASPKVNFNSGGAFPKGQHYTTLPNPIGYYTNPLADLSTQLSDLTASAGTSVKNGTFNAGSNKGIVVFDVTGTQLEADLQNSQISFVGTGVTSYIINVTGSFVEPSGTNWNAAAQRDALFNFEDATTVEVGNWKASVLAPDASISILNGYLDGSLFAKSFLGGGELHNDGLFDGALPTAAAPEPSTWAMMFAGFAGLGFLGWRRAHKVAIAAA
jgi:choice-of-anchor A domain-containing protein